MILIKPGLDSRSGEIAVERGQALLQVGHCLPSRVASASEFLDDMVNEWCGEPVLMFSLLYSLFSGHNCGQARFLLRPSWSALSRLLSLTRRLCGRGTLLDFLGSTCLLSLVLVTGDGSEEALHR